MEQSSVTLDVEEEYTMRIDRGNLHTSDERLVVALSSECNPTTLRQRRLH